MIITLPWPPRTQFPNWRGHWAVKARDTKVCRQTGLFRARYGYDGNVMLGDACWPFDGNVQIAITAHPPNARWHDDDGIATACKAYRDGIFDAFEKDDHLCKRTTCTIGCTKPGGEVQIEIKEMEE